MIVKKPFLTSLVFASITAVSVSVVAAQPKPVRVSPFSDNLTVSLQGFPAQTTVAMQYIDNNDVNISGPLSMNTTPGIFNVTIASNNQIENGFPAMVVTLPKSLGGQSCTLTFVDGPYTYLNFETGAPPVCANLQVTPIQNGSSQYLYTMTISYQ